MNTRWIILVVASLVAAPAACLFPDYTFDWVTSTGGTGGGGGATTSSSGTGGTAPTEDCLNGVDDNDDGLVDCEDLECQAGYECVDPIPAGWEAGGYLGVYAGDSSQPEPECPANMPAPAYLGHKALSYDDASCTPCGCEAPAGQDCEIVQDYNSGVSGIQGMQVSNAPCGQAATQIYELTVPNPWAGACFHMDGRPGGQTCNGAPCNMSVTVQGAEASGGTCKSKGGVPQKLPPAWQTSVKACQVTQQGKGCAAPQVCAPKPPSLFKSHVCIQRTGDVSCPSGAAFSKKDVFYTAYQDSRDCTGCACGAASKGTCQFPIFLYSDSAYGVCSTQVATVYTGDCVDLGTANPDIFGWENGSFGAAQGGSCQPTLESKPYGIVEPDPAAATTFCCL